MLGVEGFKRKAEIWQMKQQEEAKSKKFILN
jgi:hypothetical protein